MSRDRLARARGRGIAVVGMVLMLNGVACGPSSNNPNGISTGGAGASGGGGSPTGGRGGTAGAGIQMGALPPPDAGVGDTSGTAGSSDVRLDAGRSNEPPRVYCDAVAEVFRFKCGPSCHQNVGFKSGDFAVGPEEARAYVDRGSARGVNCGLVIDSRDPQNSLILTKITGDFPSPNCGAQMPVGSFEITDEEIECISDWLEQFAR